ncbi:putative glycosyl transferase [hydrocarbon metagenome]|uniref:Putative glycosyl transferase n=1 Tax=hydrocarbon metagenome TaxID=938273 RepID=A0A0W8FMX7_9ZZZZ
MFDLDYSLAADFELMVRFLEKFQVKSIYIPQIFVKMRSGGASNRSLLNIIRQNFEIYQAIKKNNQRFDFFVFVFSKLISRLRQYFSKPSVSA